MGRSVSASSKELTQNGPGAAGAVRKARQACSDFGEPGARRRERRDASVRTKRRSTSKQILTTVRETAYRWDFASDRIDWAANAEAVLGVPGIEKIAKGRAYALLVDPEQAGARYDGITGGPHVAPETELRYCLRYRFLPEGRRGRAALWVEDTGVCTIDAGVDGRAWRKARSG